MKIAQAFLPLALLVRSAVVASPASFRREVVPALTKAGCNSGTCHGTPAGKNGFRLSLRGYDPDSDFTTLTREAGARRVNVSFPEQSLFLLKGSAQVPHEGGRRMDPRSALAQILLHWISEGALDDSHEAPRLAQLSVEPASAVLKPPQRSLRISVKARFSDGSVKDVTHLARFGLNDEKMAEITADGLIDGKRRGEVCVSAEYMGQLASARLVFDEEVPGLVWEEPPVRNYIDEHVFAKLRLLRIPPSRSSTPEEFLRRAYLDSIGTLPTPREAREFLADTSPAKRERLIDDLLERPEFAQFWGLHWSDRLGCNQRFVGIMGAFKYHEWITHAMAVNLPEDQLVREILVARGGNYSHPPASFYRRLRDPETAVEAVSQLFLGVRLQCARCHNHPGDRWTQADYYGMASFFVQVKFKDGPFFHHLYDKEETVYVDRSAGEIQHPRTNAAAQPRFLDGHEVRVPPGGDRREALAAWITDPENPFFARAAVNRIWYHLFGRGIVEPVDDFRSSNPPANDALLDALAADFVRSGFDRKHLIKTILGSSTYQLSSEPNPWNAEDEQYFSHARVRLLGAEQLLDAVCAASGASESFRGLPPGFRAAQVPDGEYQNDFLNAFGRPARAMACECERDMETNFTQALHLTGGEVVESKIRSESGSVAKLVSANATPEEMVEELFLASLSRYPSLEERKTLLAKLSGSADRRKAAEDILWALVNHPEFSFQH
jgi:hypothetical protein